MRRLLVVATARVEEDVLRDRVREHTGPEEADIRVVAPASGISPLEWLASDEDDARAEAARVAPQTDRAIEPEADAVEAGVGDTDPVQAIEEALREFPADELIVVTPPGGEANWLEEDAASKAFARFDLPVTHLVVGGG